MPFMGVNIWAPSKHWAKICQSLSSSAYHESWGRGYCSGRVFSCCGNMTDALHEKRHSALVQMQAPICWI